MVTMSYGLGSKLLANSALILRQLWLLLSQCPVISRCSLLIPVCFFCALDCIFLLFCRSKRCAKNPKGSFV